MRALIGTLIFALSASAAVAQDAERGEGLYVSFCSTCHGPEGRGDGPMAPVLDILPADLTSIAADNGGVFSMGVVASKIDGRDPLLAHGGPMPLFGDFFEGEDAAIKTETGQPMLTSQAIVDLLAYLETIQE